MLKFTNEEEVWSHMHQAALLKSLRGATTVGKPASSAYNLPVTLEVSMSLLSVVKIQSA